MLKWFFSPQCQETHKNPSGPLRSDTFVVYFSSLQLLPIPKARIPDANYVVSLPCMLQSRVVVGVHHHVQSLWIHHPPDRHPPPRKDITQELQYSIQSAVTYATRGSPLTFGNNVREKRKNAALAVLKEHPLHVSSSCLLILSSHLIFCIPASLHHALFAFFMRSSTLFSVLTPGLKMYLRILWGSAPFSSSILFPHSTESVVPV